MDIVAYIVLGLIIILYVALVAGAPLGFLAMGGKHKKVLPLNMKIMVLASIPVQMLAVLVIYQLTVSNQVMLFRILGHIFMVIFSLNTLSNLVSKSKYEKIIMTPLAMFVSFVFYYYLYIV